MLNKKDYCCCRDSWLYCVGNFGGGEFQGTVSVYGVESCTIRAPTIDRHFCCRMYHL